MSRETSGASPGEMEIKPEQSKADAERKLDEYHEQMIEALASLAAHKALEGQPSDVKIILKESLVISRAFDSVLADIDGHLDIDAVQKLVDQRVTMLGLTPERFSLHTLKELISKTE